LLLEIYKQRRDHQHFSKELLGRLYRRRATKRYGEKASKYTKLLVLVPETSAIIHSIQIVVDNSIDQILRYDPDRNDNGQTPAVALDPSGRSQVRAFLPSLLF